jgi:hypothetical protein
MHMPLLPHNSGKYSTPPHLNTVRPEGGNRWLCVKQVSISAATGHAFMLTSTTGMGQNNHWCQVQQQGPLRTVLGRKGCTSAKATTQVYTLSLPACEQQDILIAVLQSPFSRVCREINTTAPQWHAVHNDSPACGQSPLQATQHCNLTLQLHKMHTTATNSTASAVCCIAVPKTCSSANTLFQLHGPKTPSQTRSRL